MSTISTLVFDSPTQTLSEHLMQFAVDKVGNVRTSALLPNLLLSIK